MWEKISIKIVGRDRKQGQNHVAIMMVMIYIYNITSVMLIIFVIIVAYLNGIIVGFSTIVLINYDRILYIVESDFLE